MFKKTKLCYAVSAAIATSVTVGPVHAAEIEEVVVTATKRAESAQDIAITVQTLDAKTLEDLNISNFEDYIRYLPGVNAAGVGPGTNDVYIRGMSTNKRPSSLANIGGVQPNVAMYLDEAPMALPGRNLDPYMTDMSRVEVLKGPQGTLFGASSQAGTIRLITNKPEFNEFGASINASVSDTSGGEISNSVEGHINIPLIDDTLAARVAFYNVKEGGYIDNVPGSAQIALSNPAFGGFVPAQRDMAVNGELVEDNFNDATFQGIRAGVKYQFNDDWDILVQHLHQELNSEGVWDFDPSLDELSVQRYSPDSTDDVYDLTSWSVNGRIAMLDVIYTGSYLDREATSFSDFTGYSNIGAFMPYYICSFPGYATCSTPKNFSSHFSGVERVTQEVRFSTDADKRWRLIGGVFYDDTEREDRGDWYYLGSIEQGFAQNSPIASATATNPNTRPPGVTFFNDYILGNEEISVFGEVAFDIIEPVTITFGARYYDLDISINGQSQFGSRGVDTDFGRNIDVILADASPASFTDTIFKAGAQWRVTDDAMVFFTWSEGYRPGGFNRNGGSGPGPIFVPDFYESDEVTNWEFGWKTSWLDGALRFNGAAYYIEWDNIQIATINFAISNLSFIDNGADAEIKGFELDSAWAVTDNITLFGNLSFNDTELTRVPVTVSNVTPEGSSLGLAPELQYTLRGRYDWEIANGNAFAQLAFQYTDDTISSNVIANLFQQDSYSTLDASLGYSRDNWNISVFFENLTDERAELFINDFNSAETVMTNRPRSIGVNFGYNWGS